MEIQKDTKLFRDLLIKENVVPPRPGYRQLVKKEKEISACKRKAATSLLIKQYLQGTLGTKEYDSGRIEAKNFEKEIIRNIPHVCNIQRVEVHKNHQVTATNTDSTPSYGQKHLQSKHIKDIRQKQTNYVNNSERRKNDSTKLDKTTYCRPATNSHKPQVMYKTIDKHRLLKLVKLLAEARRKEKQKDAWDFYITKLKTKHNLPLSEIQTTTTKALEQSHLPDELYEDVYSTLFQEIPSIDCKELRNIDTTEINPSHVSQQTMNQHSLTSQTLLNPYLKQLPLKSNKQVLLNVKSHFSHPILSKERLQKKDSLNSRDLDVPKRRPNRYESLYERAQRNIFCGSKCNRSCSPVHQPKPVSGSLTNEKKIKVSNCTRSKQKWVQSERKLESSDTTSPQSGEKMHNKYIKTPGSEQMSQPASIGKMRQRFTGKARQDKEERIRNRKRRADYLRPDLREKMQTQESARKTESSDTTELELGAIQCESVEATRCESQENSRAGSIGKIQPRSSGITHQYEKTFYDRNLNSTFVNKRSELERKTRTQKLELSDTTGLESEGKIRHKFIKRRRRESQQILSPQFSEIVIQNEEKHYDHKKQRKTVDKRLVLVGKKQMQEPLRKPKSSDTTVLNEDESYRNIIITTDDFTRSESEEEIQVQKSAPIPKERTRDRVSVRTKYGHDENVYNKVWLSKEEKQDEEEKLSCCKRKIRELLDQAYRGLVDKIQYCKDSSSEVKEEEEEIIICCRIRKSLQNILQESLKESTDTSQPKLKCEMRQDTNRSTRRDPLERLRSQPGEDTLPNSTGSRRNDSLERLRRKQRIPTYMDKDFERQHDNYISKENSKFIYCVENPQEKPSNAFWMQIRENTGNVANRESIVTLLSDVKQTDDKIVNLENILLEELNKSNKAKRDIDEILGGESSYRQCHDVLLVDMPTRDCCTEVTDSLSKANEYAKNNGELITIAVNTDPLGFLALFELSREAAGRLLSYARFTCSKMLPIPRPITLRLPMLSYRLDIRGTAGVPQLASIDEWRRQHADQQCSTPHLSPPNPKNCCVCRHLLERQNKRPVGMFPCHYCGKGFIRAYCRELHEQKCAQNQGQEHDVPMNLAILR